MAFGNYEGLRDGGDFNMMRDCDALDYNVKGYNNNGEAAWCAVIGCHAESDTADEAAASYQIDPGNTKVMGRAMLRDCTAIPNHTYGGTTVGTKFSWIKDVYLDRCQILHSSTYWRVHSFHLAGNVGRCRLKDTFLSRNVFFQSAMFPINPAEVRLERVETGDGVHLPDRSMEQARCSVLVVGDSVFRNYRSSGIDWDGADGSYSLIVARNCDFIGNDVANPTYDIAAANLPNGSGQLNRTRKLGWYANRRMNNGSGGTAQFTDPATSAEVLGSTLGAYHLERMGPDFVHAVIPRQERHHEVFVYLRHDCGA